MFEPSDSMEVIAHRVEADEALPPHIVFEIREKNPGTAMWESRIARVTTPYSPFAVRGVNSHSFVAVGFSESRGLILEKFEIPLQQGGWQVSRLGTPGTMGQSTITEPFTESVIGGGAYIPQDLRPEIILERTILVADHERGEPSALAVDPDARFVVFLANDPRGLTQVDFASHAQKDLVTPDDYPQLHWCAGADVVDFDLADRGYWIDSNVLDGDGNRSGVLIRDVNNDGIMDTDELMKTSSFEALDPDIYISH